MRELVSFTLADADSVRDEDDKVNRILSYIESKTAGNRLAKRSDINPAELKDVLSEICFFQPVYNQAGDLSDVVIRLQGTLAANFYGELTNKSVRTHPSPEVGDRIMASASHTIKNRRPTIATSASLSSEKDHLTVKVLYVPMAEDGQFIDRFLVYVRVFRKTFHARG
jgi:hypothetical protein